MLHANQRSGLMVDNVEVQQDNVEEQKPTRVKKASGRINFC